MKENKYDDPEFFESYGRMLRSERGLDGAGEWPMLREMMPDFKGKEVLDLGCGYGWHCRWAAENGAVEVTGVDISSKMVDAARRLNCLPNIEYIVTAMEDLDFPSECFDIVLSSLAFHYLESFRDIASKVSHWLKPGGHFVFSIEHPVFTAEGSQQWHTGPDGEKLHWPVDNYYYEGRREASFLGEKVIKFHRTLSTYITDLIDAGFRIDVLREAKPSSDLVAEFSELTDELRRPMMLLVSASK